MKKLFLMVVTLVHFQVALAGANSIEGRKSSTCFNSCDRVHNAVINQKNDALHAIHLQLEVVLDQKVRSELFQQEDLLIQELRKAIADRARCELSCLEMVKKEY